jgi:tRNA threonylcarbamoyladenosine biosynthesis protein TsaB
MVLDNEGVTLVGECAAVNAGLLRKTKSTKAAEPCKAEQREQAKGLSPYIENRESKFDNPVRKAGAIELNPGPCGTCVPCMASFRNLISGASPLLIVDAASTRIQAGLLQADGTQAWASSSEEAGNGIFLCLRELKVDLRTLRGFVFCEGPGSILGIRSVAAALRVWLVLEKRPVWSYRSLDLALSGLQDPSLAMIADARRDSWHLIRHGADLHRVPTKDLPPADTLRTPEGFRQWTKLPAGMTVQTACYDLSVLVPKLMDADLLQPCAAPDAFLHEEPSYVTWTPEIHRAPQA